MLHSCIRSLVAAVLVLLATSESLAQHIAIAKDFKPPAQGELIVLLPPVAEEHALERGLQFVSSQLHEQLTQAGYRVVILDKDNYEVLWKQHSNLVAKIRDSRAQVSKLELFALAVFNLAEHVGRETGASLILRPALVARAATLEGTKASWDGQSRLIQYRGLAGETSRATGSQVGVSLELLAVNGDGTLAFKAYGGASLVYIANVVAEKGELRPDLFSTPREIGDGVRIALSPLLAPPSR